MLFKLLVDVVVVIVVDVQPVPAIALTIVALCCCIFSFRTAFLECSDCLKNDNESKLMTSDFGTLYLQTDGQ